MKVIQFLRTAALASLVLLASCSKDDDIKPNNPNDSGNPPTTTLQKFIGSGSASFTGTFAGSSTGIMCNYAATKYSELADTDPNTNRVELYFAEIPAQPAHRIAFFFDGKTYPKSGTYTVSEFSSPIGTVEPGKVVVNFNLDNSKSENNQTIQLVNNNGEITITASSIKLYSSLDGSYSGSVDNIKLTKTNKEF